MAFSFRKTQKASRTTNSNHSFFKYPNLIQNLIPAEANLIFVSTLRRTHVKNISFYEYLNSLGLVYLKRAIWYSFLRKPDAGNPHVRFDEGKGRFYFMIGVYFRHARGNPDTSYDEIWEIVSPFLLYIPNQLISNHLKCALIPRLRFHAVLF